MIIYSQHQFEKKKLTPNKKLLLFIVAPKCHIYICPFTKVNKKAKIFTSVRVTEITIQGPLKGNAS